VSCLRVLWGLSLFVYIVKVINPFQTTMIKREKNVKKMENFPLVPK
jgi:hypothetical protein